MNTTSIYSQVGINAPPSIGRTGRLGDGIEVAAVIGITVLSMAVEPLFQANSIGQRVVSMAGIVATLVAVLVFHRRRGDRWSELGLARPRRWWLTVLLALPAFVIMMMMAGAFQLMVVAPLTQDAQADISRFDTLEGNFPRLLLAVLSVWVTAAFAEEVIFRGFLMGRLARLLGGRAGGWAGSLVLSSVIFGMLHLYQGLPGVLLTGFTGFLLGLLYLVVRRNLWVGIIVHGLIDTIAFVAVYLGATSS